MKASNEGSPAEAGAPAEARRAFGRRVSSFPATGDDARGSSLRPLAQFRARQHRRREYDASKTGEASKKHPIDGRSTRTNVVRTSDEALADDEASEIETPSYAIASRIAKTR